MGKEFLEAYFLSLIFYKKVWGIYYIRKIVSPFEIDKLEYEKFLSNDKELAFKCGINKELFEKNKADISESNVVSRDVLVKKIFHQSIFILYVNIFY